VCTRESLISTLPTDPVLSTLFLALPGGFERSAADTNLGAKGAGSWRGLRGISYFLVGGCAQLGSSAPTLLTPQQHRDETTYILPLHASVLPLPHPPSLCLS
jgi:hypothetical protein